MAWHVQAEALRRAEKLLGEAAAVEGGVTEATNLALEGAALLDGTDAAGALSVLGDWRARESDEQGWRRLARWAQVGLLAEAWALTRDDLSQPHLMAADLLDGWLKESSA